MNCPGHALLYADGALQLPRAAAAVGRGGRAPPRRARRRAARPPARAACSRRTTRTSSARPSRSRTRCSAASSSATRSTTGSGSRSRSSSRRGPRTSSAPTRSGTSPRRRSRRRSRRRGLEYVVERGRRRLLRPEDRPPHDRLARPLLADRHRPARLPDAAALRPPLHGRRQRRAHAGDDPPRADRLVRALHRHPDRALRRRVPALARAGAGADPPGRARTTATPRTRSPAGSRPTASRSTTPTRPSASGSATPRSRRSRSSSSTATRSRDESLAVREHGGGQSTQVAGRDFSAILATLVRLASRGGTVSHLLSSDGLGGSTERLRTVTAAACQRFLSFRRRRTTTSLVSAHLRPRRGSWEPPRRPEPQTRDQRRDPRAAGAPDRRGRAAARDQADRRGARRTPTARASTSSRSRRRPTRPSPR